jgi:Ca2+-dependent lipid-binding protein
MDPYVIIKLGSRSWKSTANKGGGKEPSWNDQMGLIPVIKEDMDGEGLLEIEVWEEDYLKSDDLVGKTKFSMHKYKKDEKTKEWVTLKYDNVESG